MNKNAKSAHFKKELDKTADAVLRGSRHPGYYESEEFQNIREFAQKLYTGNIHVEDIDRNFGYTSQKQALFQIFLPLHNFPYISFVLSVFIGPTTSLYLQ